MISENGVSLAQYSDNINVFTDTIGLFQLVSGSGGTVGTPTTTSSSKVPTTISTKVSSSSSAPTGGSSSWSLLGCYTDSVAARSLPYAAGVAGGAAAMTVELCEAACRSAGYSLAGVEYADECCEFLHRQSQSQSHRFIHTV